MPPISGPQWRWTGRKWQRSPVSASALSQRTGATLVVGIIERAGASLFCTALHITPDAGLVAHHRKLMPTAIERLLWAQGDGSTMGVVETPAGPMDARPGLLLAEADLGALAAARFDLDVSGHYARPDLFELRVDRSARPGVADAAD